MPDRRAIVCARLRMPLLWLATALIVVTAVVDRWLTSPFGLVLGVVTAAVFLLAVALYLRVGTPRAAPLPVTAPVSGRWSAMNSPADHVPSHGMHAYGQTYAIDLVHEPGDRARPGFGWWPLTLPARAFPAFGQPVLAPADGVVVRVHDRERDHRSRNSWPALLYLFAEGAVREALGPGRILGNHVVIDVGGGTYGVLAHLRRGSVGVRAGQRVVAGEQVAACGNSGNSSEPHLHFQLMDHRSVLFAAGLPFRFEGVSAQGGVPRRGRAFTATPRPGTAGEPAGA